MNRSDPNLSICALSGSNRAMRLTQFGHQVPRKNSMITGPFAKTLRNETSSAEFAEFALGSVKSGTLSPIFKVFVDSAAIYKEP